jgi:hypothetical protein
MLRINEISISDDYKITAIFDNGEKKIFDLVPYLEKGVFQELKNIEYFKSVRNEIYYIQWPHEQDLSADTLYYGGGSAF